MKKQTDLKAEKKALEAHREESLDALVIWNLKVEELAYKVQTEDASDANVKALQHAEQMAEGERETIRRIDGALKVNVQKQKEASEAAWESERAEARNKVEALSAELSNLARTIGRDWPALAETIERAVKVEKETLALAKRYELEGRFPGGVMRDTFLLLCDGLWSLRPSLPGIYGLNVHGPNNQTANAKARLSEGAYVNMVKP